MTKKKLAVGYPHLKRLNIIVWTDDPTRGPWVSAQDAENMVKRLLASIIKTASKIQP